MRLRSSGEKKSRVFISDWLTKMLRVECRVCLESD